MKSSTQITLIVFASILLMLVACLPITILAMPLMQLDQTPTQDTFATVQAMVTQTVAAQSQNAPTQTPLPPTAITNQYTSSSYEYAAAHRDGGHIL